MSYKTLYEPERNRKFPIEKDKRTGAGWVISFFVMMVVLLLISMPGLTDSVKKFLLPGDAHITEAAMTGFVSDLKTGENMTEAFTDFCIEILQNGQKVE